VVASGVYFARIVHAGHEAVQKVMLVK